MVFRKKNISTNSVEELSTYINEIEDSGVRISERLENKSRDEGKPIIYFLFSQAFTAKKLFFY